MQTPLYLCYKQTSPKTLPGQRLQLHSFPQDPLQKRQIDNAQEILLQRTISNSPFPPTTLLPQSSRILHGGNTRHGDSYSDGCSGRRKRAEEWDHGDNASSATDTSIACLQATNCCRNSHKANRKHNSEKVIPPLFCTRKYCKKIFSLSYNTQWHTSVRKRSWFHSSLCQLNVLPLVNLCYQHCQYNLWFNALVFNISIWIVATATGPQVRCVTAWSGVPAALEDKRQKTKELLGCLQFIRIHSDWHQFAAPMSSLQSPHYAGPTVNTCGELTQVPTKFSFVSTEAKPCHSETELVKWALLLDIRSEAPSETEPVVFAHRVSPTCSVCRQRSNKRPICAKVLCWGRV